jgi:hypothetical protein
VLELAAPFKAASRANSTLDAEPLAPQPDLQTAPSPRSHGKRNLKLVAAAALLISLGAWVRFSDTPQERPTSIVAAPKTVAPPVIPKLAEPAPKPTSFVAAPAPQPSVALETTPSAVLHEAKPNVPQDISNKIKGPVLVALRVLVDPSGEVVGALMENPGPSKALARLADNAAREWKFAETDKKGARVWLLRFEFTREGVTAMATEQ